MNVVYLGIGSNIYPRIYYIYQSFNAIQTQLGKIQKRSAIHRTEPWQMPESTPFFYNLCVSVLTPLSPNEILNQIIFIEKKLGRIKKRKKNDDYESRTIDIDLLLFNQEVICQENLVIPHPLMHQRIFVLLPLSEIAGSVKHPVLNTEIKHLL